KSSAGPKSIGTPVLGLTIAHSNKITAGELRIGVSEDAAQVRQCTQPPTSLHDGSLDVISLNGIPFTHFAASDAAMSHYLLVHAYRAVHGGRCYAIDLLVIGTQPQVYDPPATPPFSHAQAFAQLHTALQSFRFTPTP
ncbi:MAG: hypothetical protein L0H70_03315, partial [Xanthomonadales bacterium]|nr:hypothetical protein [Xanthomonadales bacterium]